MKNFNTLIGSINDLRGDKIYDFLNYLIHDEDFNINNDKILRLKGMIKSKSIVSIASTPSSEFSCTYDIVVYTDDGTVLSFNIIDNDLIKRALESTIYALHSIEDAEKVIDTIKKLYDKLIQYHLHIKMDKENSRKLSDLIHKSKIPTYRGTWFNDESDKGQLSSEILEVLSKLK